MQTSAEFMGNPSLDPERSTQLDLWVEAGYPKFSFAVNGFARWMENYMTIQATDFPKRLPLSPDTVYQYVNGEGNFVGFELTGSYALLDELTVWATAAYMRGDDETLNEPALGVPPINGDIGLRFEPLAGTYFVRTKLHLAAEQGRVASQRGEARTDGYATLDLQGGVRLLPGVQVRAGVNNLLDENYVNHLNARNPFSGAQIPEPGRTWFARLSYVW